MRWIFGLTATGFVCALQVACGSAGVQGPSGGSGGSSSNTASGSGSAAGTGGVTSVGGAGGTGGTGGVLPPPMPFGCVTDVSAGHHQLDCDDITYDVEIPDACAAGGCGLVLDIPGYTSNANEEDLGTGMRALGRQHGYVVVQPTAPGVPPTWIQGVDNPKLMAFVSDATHALVINPKRVHAMGFSQGGALAWGLICGYAEVLASASSLSAASPSWGDLQGCALVAPDVPSKAIPVLQAHGHNDYVVGFSLYAQTQLALAKGFWGWSDEDSTVFQTGTGYQATRYAAPGGVTYEFWEHDYYAATVALGGHCFPGGAPAPVGSLSYDYSCVPPNGFVYGQVAMQFFVDHPQE